MYAHDVCHEYVLRGHDENDSYRHEYESYQHEHTRWCIKSDTTRNEVEALRTSAHRGGVLRDEAATTQMRGAMKIAAQSVVAYLPIVRCAPLRPDARASGRGGY